MRGYFERCLPSIPVKKRFREFTRKSVKFREFKQIRVKKCELAALYSENFKPIKLIDTKNTKTIQKNTFFLKNVLQKWA
jgi:hypothetical protein